MIGKIEIRLIPAEQTIDLRHRVMWPSLPKDSVVLDGDSDATHFGAYIDETLVGVGSFFEKDGAFRLRKLAVDAQFQGVGIASRLLEVAMKVLRDRGCERIWCDARVSAISFYLRNGFQLDTIVFQKNGLDYVVATRDL